MKRATLLLLVVGLLQMSGDLLRVPALKGIGAATGASPAPKVFSAVQGLETYSTRFFIEWTDADGRTVRHRITSAMYDGIAGPYNRRNVYGAALAYGPVLSTNERTRPMYDAVVSYALCGQAPLLRELGLDPGEMAGPPRIVLEPVAGSDLGGLPTEFEAPCR